MEDKPSSFANSKEWIGSVEVGLVLDQFCNVPCRIVDSRSGSELNQVFSQVFKHFIEKKCPIMMGGDLDCSSKGIFGACEDGKNFYFLVVDPHFVKTSDGITEKNIVDLGWAKWIKLEDFVSSSFYNLCIPQVK